MYDPLDRTTSQTTAAGTPEEETTVFTYLGVSEQVLTEEVDGALTVNYEHGAGGEMVSQTRHDVNAGDGEEESFYGYNPHGDVAAITDETGNTRATYGYTAYGSDDETLFTGVDRPEAGDPTGQEPYNAYRYAGQRFNSATGTYDMGFRDYSPGLNRFLTRDMFNGALADMSLGTNPWTLGRYTFAGGNPTTLIEIDGHVPANIDEGGGESHLVLQAGGRDFELGPAWQDLPDCVPQGWIEPGEASCPPAGSGGPGLEPLLEDIVLAAYEADIDPRMLLSVLIIESNDDHSDDWRWVDINSEIAGMTGGVSVGVANMQAGTFITTIKNHPEAFGLPPIAGEPGRGNAGIEQMWQDSMHDEVLSIRAAAYHLRDLMDQIPLRSETGVAYSPEQLAAIGYNVGSQFMIEIATGTYPSEHGTSAPMGPAAAHYLGVFNHFWETANTWICHEGVLVC